MVWIIGVSLMVLFGAGLVAIGLYLPSLACVIIGGIMVVVGIFLLVSMRRSGGPLARGLWG